MEEENEKPPKLYIDIPDFCNNHTVQDVISHPMIIPIFKSGNSNLE